MSWKKPKNRKKAPLTNPDAGHPDDQKDTAHVYVHGAIEAHPPQSLLDRHNAERKEDSTTRITERKEDRGSEGKKLLLELGTFVAVAVYASVAWWQGCLLKQSIQNAQENFIKDQRAWISVSVPNFFPLDGQTIPLKIQIVDTGKTVAKNVNGDFFATVLDKGEKPPFDKFGVGHPHNRIYAGAIFPTATPPLESVVTVVKYGAGAPVVIVPDQALRDKILTTGESYIVFFGKITYCDVFHVKHWTSFCNGSGKALDLSGVKECIAYNDVDTDTEVSPDCK